MQSKKNLPKKSPVVGFLIASSSQQGRSLRAPGNEKAPASTRDGEEGVGGSRAKLCTWPPPSPPTLFPLPVSCYDFFPPFGAGKRGIQAWKAPGTAASAKHRGILHRVCVLAALPWLISCQRLPSHTQWWLKRSLSCVEQVQCCWGTQAASSSREAAGTFKCPTFKHWHLLIEVKNSSLWWIN